jgi:hypothetical protein
MIKGGDQIAIKRSLKRDKRGVWYLIQQQVVAAFRAPDPFGTGA